ncbi:hypothetical protein Clacol_004231 [Clathrus columnatus]|uniref:Uncharacterized protein n=1 Tax=Clathrus columnatus TaxID=1419009 RepID=A0AAV5A6U3_9AGAM|nr:hypothetical protein Clacol_004231 [Clathrus columnatus]
MTPKLFTILSRLSNLKVLLMLSSTPNFVDVDFVKTLMKQKLIDDEAIKEFSPFHSLTDLFICDNNNSHNNQVLTTSTVLTFGFQFLKLTHLVCSPFTKTSEEITGLMELVHSVCPILKIITIKRPSGSSTRIPWQAIQALLKCPRLRTLEVFNRTVDMELNDIHTVATNRSSWQSINLPSTQPLSYEALLYFAQNCPELGKLGLTLDNIVIELPYPHINVDTSSNKTDILFSSLHTLNVGESPITSPVNIGIFLSRICGNTLKIISSEGGKYSQSWKTVSDIVDSMNSTARVRMLNKEVAGLRETVAGLKRLRKRINSPPQFKVKFKNES